MTDACDRNYKAPSKQWSACYDEVAECRRRVNADNEKIYEYNSFISKCRSAEAARKKSSSPALVARPNPSVGGGIDWKARADAARARAKGHSVQEDSDRNLAKVRGDIAADERRKREERAARLREEREREELAALERAQEEARLLMEAERQQWEQQLRERQRQFERQQRQRQQSAHRRALENQQMEMFLQGLINGLDAAVSSGSSPGSSAPSSAAPGPSGSSYDGCPPDATCDD
ncbi:MAG: hypothetical protein E5X67_35770 [Mesorhizobium sp.]|uniref:hypothetical protein n=1 Tax=Mesorhizobium sp. TaxID=1871066 RepID=UPI0011FFE842|nr:hypothetical protein [Mesorhizobium sp.]TIP22827.1 MAG: hypothetical protein E5X67_35770 [Mesorhizobium sp.]